MPQSFDVLFASTNRNKFAEASSILSKFGIKAGFFKSNLEEIQADSISDIASHKAAEAFRLCKKPVIVEDDGLIINSLNGFPGPFSSYVFQTIGNRGILNLLSNKRSAKFHSVIAYCDKKNKITLFSASVKGKISKKLSGKGWGYDPIFIPEGKKQSYALLQDKNKISHRYKALKKFSNWYGRKIEFGGR